VLASRKQRLLVLAVALIAIGVGLYFAVRYPPDTTVEGVYARIARAVGRDDPTTCFAYLENDAQHAAFTIVDYAKKAEARIREAYPPEDRDRELPRYEALAQAASGAELWTQLARDNGYLVRLRKDMSGIDKIVYAGERATVVTVRGTRYSFRRRPNGIWGLTLFTAELESEAARIARDWERIQQAANDYEAAR